MSRTLSRVPVLVTFFSFLLVYFPSCERTAKTTPAKSSSVTTTASSATALTTPTQGLLDGASDVEENTPADYRRGLPANFGRWTGDWNAIRKHNILRMLVVYSKTSFFYDRG